MTDPVVLEYFLYFLDFGKGQTEDDIIGGGRIMSLAIEKNLTDSRLIVCSHLEKVADRTCKFNNFTADLQLYSAEV